jgi:hypothetical protein
METSKSIEYQRTGFHPYDYPPKLKKILKGLLEEGALKEGDIFLDLGAGKGTPMRIAASKGFRAYGIDLNETVVDEGVEEIRVARETGEIPRDAVCELVQGSYFPKEYIALRESGKSIAVLYESGNFFTHFPGGEHLFLPYDPDEKRERFHPVSSDNSPYENLGIRLQEVDLFFSYTWGPELPSQLELFSKFASPEAIFVNHWARFPENGTRLIEELGLFYETISVWPIIEMQAYSQRSLEAVLKNLDKVKYDDCKLQTNLKRFSESLES